MLTTASLSGGGRPGCPGASTCFHPRPPAMSPHANGTTHPSHWFNSGRIKGAEGWGKRMIQRLNEENGRRENTVLSTWRRCKQGWPRLSQTTDRLPRSRSLLLNKYLFNLIYILGYIFLKIYPNKK